MKHARHAEQRSVAQERVYHDHPESTARRGGDCICALQLPVCSISHDAHQVLRIVLKYAESGVDVGVDAISAERVPSRRSTRNAAAGTHTLTAMQWIAQMSVARLCLRCRATRMPSTRRAVHHRTLARAVPASTTSAAVTPVGPLSKHTVHVRWRRPWSRRCGHARR